MSLTQGGQHLLYFFHIAAERRGGFPDTVGQLAKFILGRIFKINFQSALGDVLSGFLYFFDGLCNASADVKQHKAGDNQDNLCHA